MDRANSNHPHAVATRARMSAFGRRCAAAAVPLAALGTAVAIAAGGGGSTAPTLSAAASGGSISIQDSRAGKAILTAGPLKPGDSAGGFVTITNSGTPAAVRLSKAHLMDRVGAYGGALSSRLQLTIEDAARPGSPLYSGPLGSLPNVALGTFAKGEAHTYAFTATLPNGGAPSGPTTGDNLFQGSQTTVEFDWTATGSGVTPPPSNPVLTFAGKSPQSFGNGVSVRASCTLACKVRVSGSVSIEGSRRKYALPTGVISIPGRITTTAALRLSKAARRAIAKAFARHKRVSAKVTGALPGGSPHQLTIVITKH